ncbi:MAG: hypothetical protein ABIJ56_06985 [Pseudomonadota bacterium]
MDNIDLVQEWLTGMADDIQGFVKLMEDDRFPAETRQKAAGVVNYLFKSIDLIPDGIDDIGFLDDVMTMRLCASGLDVGAIEPLDVELASKLKALGEDSSKIREILGEDIHRRFSRYVAGLSAGSARGRSAGEIVSLPDKLREVQMEANNFCKEYIAPQVEKSDRTLIKLKSFLDTRLPK